jgi:hypothetical protein
MRDNTNFWFTGKGLVAALGISFLAYFLFVEHREHVIPYLPYMILLLCPLMHIFMHSGHGAYHESDDENYQRGYEEGLKQSQQHEDENHVRK